MDWPDFLEAPVIPVNRGCLEIMNRIMRYLFRHGSVPALGDGSAIALDFNGESARAAFVASGSFRDQSMGPGYFNSIETELSKLSDSYVGMATSEGDGD